MAQSHDEEFVEFADSALPRLRRTAYLLCADWHRAEDVAQEALVKLYLAWPRVARREGLMPYANRTVLRLVIDHSRRPWRRETSQAEALEPEQRIADPALRVADRMLLVSALQEVSPRRRACIVLRYLDDLSVTQTAFLLGCTEGAVKSQTSRGLDELRGALARLGITDIQVREEAHTA